jgi:hypothetical protein
MSKDKKKRFYMEKLIIVFYLMKGSLGAMGVRLLLLQ